MDKIQKSCAPCKAAASRLQESKVTKPTEKLNIIEIDQLKTIQTSIDCTDVTVHIDKCYGSLVFPPWNIEKSGVSECYNANGDENPSATFKVKVTRPNVPPTLAWFVSYTVANNTGTSIESRSCDIGKSSLRIKLYKNETTLIDTYYASAINFDNKISVSGIYSNNTILVDNLCEETDYSVKVEFCYNCKPTCSNSPRKLTAKSDCSCNLLTVSDCSDTRDYVLNDILTGDCTNNTLTLDKIEGAALDCSPSISALQSYLGKQGNAPFVVQDDDYILIEHDCFSLDTSVPPKYNPITFTFTATCDNTPETCVTPAIKFANKAFLTPASLKPVNSTVACSLDTNKQEVIGPNINDSSASEVLVCLSTVKCDVRKASAVAESKCVSPTVCVVTELNCPQSLCVCKTSTVIPPKPAICPTRTQGCWLNNQNNSLGCTNLREMANNYTFYFPVKFTDLPTKCEDILNLTTKPSYNTVAVSVNCVESLKPGNGSINTFIRQLFTALLNAKYVDYICPGSFPAGICTLSDSVLKCICDSIKFITNALEAKKVQPKDNNNCAGLTAILAALDGYNQSNRNELNVCLTKYNESGDFDCVSGSFGATPAQIEYDIIFTELQSQLCQFTPKFTFNACPGTETNPRFYRYEITKNNGDILSSGDNIEPCDDVTTSGDVCLTCPTSIPASCFISASPISLADLDEGDILTLTIYTTKDSEVEQVELISTNICIPSDGLKNVWVGDCIKNQGDGCDITPTGDNIVVTSPSDTDTLPVGETRNAAQIRDAIKTLLLNGIFACDFVDGKLIPSRQLTDDEVDLLLAYGLHYTITLPNNCCSFITVSNTVRLVTGVKANSDGKFPINLITTLSTLNVIDTTNTVVDTVQFPVCSPPVAKSNEKVKVLIARKSIFRNAATVKK